MILQYDGTRYNGWQKQAEDGQHDSGQARNAVVQDRAGEPVEIHGAGRTDAGVHAAGQVANAKFHTDLSDEELLQTINHYSAGRHRSYQPRADAGALPQPSECGGQNIRIPYRDRWQKACFRAEITCIFRKHRSTVEKMKEASKAFIGTYDFRSFCANKRMKKSTVRTITGIDFCEKDGILTISYTGTGFLYHMVRILDRNACGGWDRENGISYQ